MAYYIGIAVEACNPWFMFTDDDSIMFSKKAELDT